MADAGRVITGSAKGLRLEAAGAGTRALSDRVKQALFATLAADCALDSGSAFLDLYAGSGAGGIEALSRGCGRAVFVERDRHACAVIAANLRRAGLAGGSVIRADVLRFLDDQPRTAGGPFDAALIDPPYDEQLLGPTLERLAGPRRGWLTAGAIVVAKHFWRAAPEPRVGDLAAYRERRFGDTMLTFYRVQDEESA
jgi:16S rRNA (guanine966-N2)-methyltransferase